MEDLADRHVVVTGGTGGLGLGVVEVMLELGAHVHVPCLEQAELEQFPWRDHQRVHVTLPVDLTDEAAVADYYAALPGLWASIQVAGGFGMHSVDALSVAAFEQQQRINAVTCMLACREAVARLRAAGGGGRLVNVSARPALDARQGAGMAPYVMAKAGVAALTQSLAEELLAEDILVNAIAPSVIDTPANRAAMGDADAGNWVTPRAAAEVVAFLASPRNSVVSGAVIPVYGRA